MRIAAFILFSLLSTLAGANGLPASASGAPAAESPAAQAATALVGQTGAAMGGDALQCDRSIVIENAETAKAISDKAVSDADSFANRLAELPAGAQASVATLASAYTLDRSLLNRAFFAKVCERLAEKGISPAELKPALQNLAQALGVTYPEQATGADQHLPRTRRTHAGACPRPPAADPACKFLARRPMFRRSKPRPRRLPRRLPNPPLRWRPNL